MSRFSAKARGLGDRVLLPLSKEGPRAMCLLRRRLHRSAGMYLFALFLQALPPKACVRPILEFGCVVASALTSCSLRMKSLAVTPRYVASNDLLLEAELPRLLFLFGLLPVQTFIRVISSPIVHQAGSNYLSVRSYLSQSWRPPDSRRISFGQS